MKETRDPAIIVIFGITGDLSQRYLLPSLYHLIKDDLLHPQTTIVGVTRRDMTARALLDKVELCINETDKVCDPVALQAMHERTRMFQMDLTDEAGYKALRAHLDEIEESVGQCMNRLYYLSIPPQVYDPVVKLLGAADLNTSCQHGNAQTRLLVEKPFGFDYPSAQDLIANTAKVFSEDQLYRIDHYLAKETVQNILTFRAHNPIFEAIWSRDHIAQIDITAYEKIGIEGRAVFYEPLGALRDFIQSHLMQIMAIVTMDQPTVHDSQHIHASKQALLEQVQTVPADKITERAVRGQYASYRREVDNLDSMTETYASVTLYIDNERWQGVPIRLATGKAMRERKTEITITFNDSAESPNRLHFRIQPDEGIALELQTKRPGFGNETQTTVMNFSYDAKTNKHMHPDAYERVLVDAVRGDHTLFATSQEVLESWRALQPIVHAWGRDGNDLVPYAVGSTTVG